MAIPVLERAAVGAPITRCGVSLFPVYLHGDTPPEVAHGGNDVVVSEAPDAVVPMITVANANSVPVLLVEGEVLRGGQQDRTLNVSVVVPPMSVIDCPVSCVERGRWHGEAEFGRSEVFASRRVRRAKTFTVGTQLHLDGSRRSDQGTVWDAVDFELDRLEVDAPTGALREADAVLGNDSELADAVGELVRRGPLPGQRGVVVTHGDRVVACDVFASPDLLAARWEALVRGYCLDAPDRPTRRPSATNAVRFLRAFASASGTTIDGVGSGIEHHVRTNRLVGQALVVDDGLVHASAFALAV